MINNRRPKYRVELQTLNSKSQLYNDCFTLVRELIFVLFSAFENIVQCHLRLLSQILSREKQILYLYIEVPKYRSIFIHEPMFFINQKKTFFLFTNLIIAKIIQTSIINVSNTINFVMQSSGSNRLHFNKPTN